MGKTMELKVSGNSYEALNTFIGASKEVLEEGCIHVTKDGFHLLGMDPSHVAMVDISMIAAAFKEYDPHLIDGEDERLLSLNLKELSKFVERFSKKEQTMITLNDMGDKLRITGTVGNRKRGFNIPLLDPLDEEVPSPKITFHTEVRMTLDEVNLAVADVSLVSEHIAFEAIDGTFRIVGDGDTGDSFGEWTENSDGVLSVKIDEASRATYTLSYIKDILKGFKGLSEVVKIKLSKDMPISISAEGALVGGGEGEDSVASPGIKVAYYLAPCISPN